MASQTFSNKTKRVMPPLPRNAIVLLNRKITLVRSFSKKIQVYSMRRYYKIKITEKKQC